MARRPRITARNPEQAPAQGVSLTRALTPAPTQALDGDGDGAAGGSLAHGEQMVTVTEAGGGRISDGAGATHDARTEIVVTDAQAQTLRACGFVV